LTKTLKPVSEDPTHPADTKDQTEPDDEEDTNDQADTEHPEDPEEPESPEEPADPEKSEEPQGPEDSDQPGASEDDKSEDQDGKLALTGTNLAILLGAVGLTLLLIGGSLYARNRNSNEA